MSNVERSQNAFGATDKHRNLSISQWRLLSFAGRMSRESDPYDPYCAIFFSLPEGLGPNEPIFLGYQ